MQVEVTMTHRRCYRCRRWYGAEHPDVPCGACAQDELRDLNARISTLLRSNAALRGALKRRRKR